MEIKFLSYQKGGVSTEESKNFVPDEKGVENQVINLYPDVTYQTIEGFGGAITDASGYVYSLMSREDKETLLKAYFTEDGFGYNRVRIHMDSCDFSTHLYEAMSDPEDTKLSSFSFADTEKYILPLLQDASKISSKPLKLMLTPWSPPAFMKTNGERVHGGKLKPEYADLWAKYICRYIREFTDRGFEVERISIQNEAKAWQTWDSCIYTAEEERDFLIQHLHPAMVEAGFENIEVFFWDHNKERAYERAKVMMESPAKDLAAGIALHWYSGDHFDSMDMIHEKYPELKMIISESCIEIGKFAGDSDWDSAARLSHEMIGDLKHGLAAFYDWNILLDEKGGPNHVQNYCLAPFHFDTKAKKLLPQNIAHNYRLICHYVKPGSVRIGTTCYTDKIDVVSFCTPDDELVIVLLNRTTEEIPVVLRLEGQIVEITLPAQSISTGVGRLER